MEYPDAVEDKGIKYTERITYEVRQILIDAYHRFTEENYDEGDEGVEHPYHAVLHHLYEWMIALIQFLYLSCYHGDVRFGNGGTHP